MADVPRSSVEVALGTTNTAVKRNENPRHRFIGVSRDRTAVKDRARRACLQSTIRVYCFERKPLPLRKLNT